MGCLIRGKRGITFFGYLWLDRVMKNSRTRFIFLIYYNFPDTLLYHYLFIPYYISAIPIWSYSRVKCNFELIKQVLLGGLCIRDLGVETKEKRNQSGRKEPIRKNCLAYTEAMYL